MVGAGAIAVAAVYDVIDRLQQSPECRFNLVQHGFAACTKALVARFLPGFAPVDHLLVQIGNALLTFGHVVRRTSSKAEGRTSEKHEAEEVLRNEFHEVRIVIGGKVTMSCAIWPRACALQITASIGPKSDKT